MWWCVWCIRGAHTQAISEAPSCACELSLFCSPQLRNLSRLYSHWVPMPLWTPGCLTPSDSELSCHGRLAQWLPYHPPNRIDPGSIPGWRATFLWLSPAHDRRNGVMVTVLPSQSNRSWFNSRPSHHLFVAAMCSRQLCTYMPKFEQFVISSLRF